MYICIWYVDNNIKRCRTISICNWTRRIADFHSVYINVTQQNTFVIKCHTHIKQILPTTLCNILSKDTAQHNSCDQLLAVLSRLSCQINHIICHIDSPHQFRTSFTKLVKPASGVAYGNCIYKHCAYNYSDMAWFSDGLIKLAAMLEHGCLSISHIEQLMW